MKSICIALLCLLVLSAGVNAQFKLSQSVDGTTITPLNSVACPPGPNGYFRFYNITAEGELAPTIFITDIRFAIESSPAPFPAEIRIYETPTGNTLSAGFTLLHTELFTMPTGSGIVTQPISPVLAVANNPANDLVIELFTPPGATFFIGSNAAGQTGLSFLQSAPCGAAEPTDIGALGFPTMHMILDVCYATTPPTFTYPGTQEDLDAFFALNLGGFTQVSLTNQSTTLNSNDCIEMVHVSQGGTFTGTGQYFAVGSLVMDAVTIPEVGMGTNIFVDVTGGAFLFDGLTSILGNPTQLPANGSAVKFTYPGGAVGFKAVVQGFVLDGAAANGNYAATNGFTIDFSL